MSIVTKQRFGADKARLAELEAVFQADPDAPFVKANLESFRRRVAGNRLASAPNLAPVAATPAPMPAAPKLAEPPLDPEADRIARLRRLAAFMDGTDEELEAAISGSTSPDDFALMLTDGNAVDRLARRIAGA